MGEPLAEEIRHVNKNSLNLHAELLLLLAAHEKPGAVSREDAVKFAADFYRPRVSPTATSYSAMARDFPGAIWSPRAGSCIAELCRRPTLGRGLPRVAARLRN